MKSKCHFCGKTFEKSLGHFNRAKKEGLNIYCNRKCAGMGRRSYMNLSEEQKKLIKYFYDSFIYLVEPERFKKESHEWFKKDYAANPEKYREQRKRRYRKHLKYLQRPEYKKWKQKYDQKYRAKKLYGNLWESAIALCELGRIVDNREAKKQQGNNIKSQKRKRHAKKYIKRKELESCVMGLYQPS